MRIRWAWSSILAMALSLLLAGQAMACTGIVLVAADGTVVRGRTLEFGHPLDSDVIVIPRGHEATGTTPDGKSDGLKWTATYAAAGANGVGLPIIVDGLNERGLGGGIFYFPGFAGYQHIAADERSVTLAPWEVVTWALTSFASVDDLRAAAPDIRVGAAALASLGGVPPMHYYFKDATGDGLIIEYVDGEMKMFDDQVGVFTNSPGYEWHLTNLRNYLTISPDPQAAVTLDGLSLDPLSNGGNLFGMPGDFSSPSRFVRATVFSRMMPQQASGEDAVMEGFHILDNFDIPLGSVPEPSGSTPPDEITEWTSMSDLGSLTFYIWTSGNRAIQTLSLHDVDLDSNEVQTFSLDADQQFIDLLAR